MVNKSSRPKQSTYTIRLLLSNKRLHLQDITLHHPTEDTLGTRRIMDTLHHPMEDTLGIRHNKDLPHHPTEDTLDTRNTHNLVTEVIPKLDEKLPL